MRFVCLVLILFCFIACERPQSDRVTIAVIPHFDRISLEHALGILSTEGILAEVDYSRGWFISVTLANQKNAVDVLEEACKERPFRISLFDRETSDIRPKPTVLCCNKSYVRLLDDDIFDIKTMLGAALRNVDVIQAGKTHGFVKGVTFVQREYVQAEGVIAKGMEVSITLVEDLMQGAATRTLDIMVWNNGTETQYHGGSAVRGRGDPIETQRRVFTERFERSLAD